jgi:hypothetical protein
LCLRVGRGESGRAPLMIQVNTPLALGSKGPSLSLHQAPLKGQTLATQDPQLNPRNFDAGMRDEDDAAATPASVARSRRSRPGDRAGLGTSLS